MPAPLLGASQALSGGSPQSRGPPSEAAPPEVRYRPNHNHAKTNLFAKKT